MTKLYCQNNFNQKKFDEIYQQWKAAYHVNRLAENRAMAEIHRHLERFVYKSLWEQFPRMMEQEAIREELIQESWTEIVRTLPTYDNSRGGITTYVKICVKHAGYAYCNLNLKRTTIYYSQMMKKIESGRETLERSGQEITADSLAMITGLSKKTVVKALEYAQHEAWISYEDAFQQYGKTEEWREQGPESLLLKKELASAIRKFVTTLSEEEKMVCDIIWESNESEGKKVSYREIAAEMDRRSAKIADSKSQKYSPDKIRTIIGRIRKKAKVNQDLQEYYQ